MKHSLLFIILIFVCLQATAQNENSEDSLKQVHEKMSMAVFKDSLDGKFDMSDFLIGFHGFIPLANLITEPALGSIGLMLGPVFISPNKYQEKGEYIPPNITAMMAGYTANNSWFAGAFRRASLPKLHLRYTVEGVYGNINMDFYRDLPVVGERKFGFNFSAIGGMGTLLRQIGQSELYIGLNYSYFHNDVTPEFEFQELPDFIDERDLESNLSSMALVIEYDKRDNVFTPNKGSYIGLNAGGNASWLGSDYDFQDITLIIYKYFQFTPKWVSGFRLDINTQYGDAPFYLKPSVMLRGVPMSRYQGNETYVFETEQRYDFLYRWSVVAFTGIAKAPTDKVDFSSADIVYNYGTGFRYLIARKFKVRMGVDVAWSNEDFGWYIAFGSAWNTRN